MDDPTAGRKDSCFQGVPIFRGFSARYPVSCGENLWSMGFSYCIFGVSVDTNKGVVTDYMGVRVPLGTFTKGGTPFHQKGSLLYGGGNSLRSLKFLAISISWRGLFSEVCFPRGS